MEAREGGGGREGGEGREGREVGRWVGRLGETRRECSIVADEYLINYTTHSTEGGYMGVGCVCTYACKYKIVRYLTSFSPNTVVLKSLDRLPAHLLPCTSLLRILIDCCFFSSFVPHAVSHWNSLPEPVVSAPSLVTFKHTFRLYYNALRSYI